MRDAAVLFERKRLGNRDAGKKCRRVILNEPEAVFPLKKIKRASDNIEKQTIKILFMKVKNFKTMKEQKQRQTHTLNLFLTTRAKGRWPE
ncbi:MAG: hypothetical protein D6714_15370 [Bacteroidetes bacterium]|nr:MAG: hypothetical protein D6714_15370 [Bacteroidota bacterium]